MQIIVTGINHRTAPIEVRERVMLLQDDLAPALADLKDCVSEGAILSTCNRTEVYANVPDGAQGIAALTAYLSASSGFSEEQLRPHLYSKSGDDAVRHLFAVASGIDSQILGETEIVGQVRGALSAAADAETVDVPLVRLFHAALHAGHVAREQTAISRHAVSVSSAGVQMARNVFGGLTECRVLVISAGEAGSLTARALKDAGAAEIAIANRTRSRATDLARELGGRALDFEDIPGSLQDFDVVISATASSRYVISSATVAAAMRQREGRPLCLVDIAVPRDIDPESRGIKNVHLFDIDDLEAVSLLGLAERRKSVADVERIVDAETVHFMEWFSTLEALPVVRAIHEKAEAIRQRELAKTLKRLEHLSPADRERIEALTVALTNKLLHDPITTLKGQGSRAADIEAARDLFRLSASEEP